MSAGLFDLQHVKVEADSSTDEPPSQTLCVISRRLRFVGRMLPCDIDLAPVLANLNIRFDLIDDSLHIMQLPEGWSYQTFRNWRDLLYEGQTVLSSCGISHAATAHPNNLPDFIRTSLGKGENT